MKTVRVLQCVCGNDSFCFRWETNSLEQEHALMYCHDGYGFQLEDAIIKCSKCGKESPYEQEEFLKMVKK